MVINNPNAILLKISALSPRYDDNAQRIIANGK